jgi:hypothetical protein
MDPLEDEGGLPGEFMDVPAPEGGEDVPWAHRVADEVEGPDSEWFRNQGWKGPEDAARSFRETKAELTRVQQEYARTLDALRASEEAPEYGYGDGGQQAPAGDDFIQQANLIAQAIDAGELEAGRGMAYLVEAMDKRNQQLMDQRAQQTVAPLAKAIEEEQLGKTIAKMEGIYGPREARQMGQQVMRLLNDPRLGPLFSTPQGLEHAFHSVAGQASIERRVRDQRAPGMETVDHSSRQRQQHKTYASALENWLVTPPNQ